MPSQNKLIKTGIKYTDSLFKEIDNRLARGVKQSDTLESFITKTKDYTISNPLVVTGYKDKLTSIILQETNNHKFSRPAQKELTRVVIENSVGDLIVGVGEDIKTNVRDIVKQGYNNGLSQNEIADNISHKIKTIKNKRARAIARTEVARTATISDYVINKERGAKSFTVDCRNTACTYCKNKVLSNPNIETNGKSFDGDVRFSIEDTDSLPPYHPNCRCVALFSMEEPPVNNVNNNEFHELNPNKFRSREDLERLTELEGWKPLTEKNVPNYFDEELKKSIIIFDNDYKVFEDGNEWSRVYNIPNKDISDLYSDEKSDGVNPLNVIDSGTDEIIVLHNHPDETFLSPDDFAMGFFRPENIKYITVHTNNYIYIAKFKDIKISIDEFNIFTDAYDKIRTNSSPENCWLKFNSNEVTRKYVSVDMVSKNG